MKDFYQKKIEEIKKLMKFNKNLALEHLKEELGMPYIPKKYEIQFQELINELKIKTMKEAPKKVLLKEQIIEFLNSKNSIKIAIAIDALENHNLRTITKELKQWIEADNDKIGKAFIYESLVSQEIDVNLNIDGIKINPKFTKSFFNDEQIVKSFKVISNITEKVPHLKESIEEQFKLYILLSFPQKLIDCNQIVKNIFNIVKFMVGENTVLSDEEKNIYKILKDKHK